MNFQSLPGTPKSRSSLSRIFISSESRLEASETLSRATRYVNASDEAKAEIAHCLSILNGFLGVSLGGYEAVTASDVA